MINSLRKLSAVLMFIGLLLLAACKQEATPEKVADASSSRQKNSQENQSEPVSQTKNSGEKERMTSLYQVVSLFAARSGAPWASFDAVPGVQWRDASPKVNSDSTDPQNAQYRSGTLLLDGFGAVDVPMEVRVQRSRRSKPMKASQASRSMAMRTVCIPLQ
ncbi:hypothetical protein ABFU27_06835 [Xanthomonas campestris pv. raphani]|uniref:hypothetical protein n=1 Tax=Xanthomonas campestris TaxID=339 RepID=UPI001E58484C|nr:hypothetical protein [Xanthomonas campestris]MCC8686467.1 hypothetical protein [Xanthomonas campestris]MCC8691309.1 hypothetical protein [Xanthomonas campestris]MEA9681228.1 hypothetical protein [Xanthomonas campestris pv. raphani]MEA9701123.1 hypothetical protein [Xanthomonas campestris pv. raphani]MEA9729276.1 hypothetical protein [Xanthomonas campestris pv. raphani]